MAFQRPERTLRPLVFGEPLFCCEEAEHFSAWIDKLIAGITRGGASQPTAEQLDKAKVLLVDEYRKARNGATKAHRDRLLDKEGRPCIYGVFIATIDRLAEIVIDPPKIPRQPSAPRPTISKRQQEQQRQSQRFFGLPAFEIVPDES
jgi:hypothetical protein